MNHQQSLHSLREIVRWIDDHTSGLELPNDRRSQIVSGCLDVALEHQAAIAVLCTSELYGSMLALLRVLTESVVRGLWFLHCASEEELHRYEKRGIDKDFGTLVTEVETKIEAPTQTLSQMKANGWKAMNGFTHTGYIQVTRRHSEGSLGSNYPEADLVQCLQAAGALGLIASAQLSAMARRDTLVQSHIAKMQEYAVAP